MYIFHKFQAKETVKPLDPVAARLEAANKASAIMASAVKPSEYFHFILYPFDLEAHRSLFSIIGETNPQEALARFQEAQMSQLRAKAEAAAQAANLPSYYNPLSVNAAKLAEQQQKRKLLWSKKSNPSKESKDVSYLDINLYRTFKHNLVI